MFTTLDWVLIVAYLAVVLGIGLGFSRRAGRSVDDFFLSGRRLPWWLAGTSLVATSFSADTPLVVTGWTRTGGVAGNWRWWGYAVSGTLVIVLFARLWRRIRVMTDVEFIELRYGGGPGAFLRGFRGIFNPLVFQALTIAWVLLAGRKLIGAFLDLDATGEILVVAVLAASALAYAVLSGLWGVVFTDLLQFVIAMVGSITLVLMVLPDVGGLTGLTAQLEDRQLDVLPSVNGSSGGDIFSFLVFVLVLWWAFPNSDGGGAAVQRFSSSRDERESMRAALWFNVAHYAVRPWPWILVALASLLILPDLVDPEMAYPMMMKLYLPPGLLGLTAVSLVAAFMSTIDTYLNLGSAYFVNDFYRRFAVRGRSERHYVAVGRLWALLLMGAGAGIAMASESVRGLFDLFSQLTAGVGPVYIARWLWWRTNAFSEIVAMLASVLFAVLLGVLTKHGVLPWAEHLSFAEKLVLTVSFSTPLWIGATLLTPAVSQERLAAFYQRARPPGIWDPVRRNLASAPRTPAWFTTLVGWLGGVLLVLGLTFGVGWLLLGATLPGVAGLVAAVIGVFLLWPALRIGET